MPANSDHTRRDAEHAARAEISIRITPYVRRALEAAKAHIANELAEHEGGPIDGIQLGREAATVALNGLIGVEDVHEPVEALPPAAE